MPPHTHTRIHPHTHHTHTHTPTHTHHTHTHPHTHPHTQLHCLQLIYKWRDDLARAEDESTGYVLPNHMLFQISEILPRDPQGVLACCNPIPTMLRQQVQEVNMQVQKARSTPLTSIVSASPGVQHEIVTFCFLISQLPTVSGFSKEDETGKYAPSPHTNTHNEAPPLNSHTPTH